MILGLRTCIYSVPNLREAIAWYNRAFQVEPYFNESFYAGYSVGGYELGLIPVETETQVKGHPAITYWGVDNVEKEYQHFISLGAKPIEEPTHVGGDIVVASVRDPWGNAIGLIYNPEFEAK
ncbi:MAG: VOC family protein [Bacteroidetes bacterium]|nr:VOC family protein [Bacteroidota bacterium]